MVEMSNELSENTTINFVEEYMNHEFTNVSGMSIIHCTKTNSVATVHIALWQKQ